MNLMHGAVAVPSQVGMGGCQSLAQLLLAYIWAHRGRGDLNALWAKPAGCSHKAARHCHQLCLEQPAQHAVWLNVRSTPRPVPCRCLLALTCGCGTWEPPPLPSAIR